MWRHLGLATAFSLSMCVSVSGASLVARVDLVTQGLTVFEPGLGFGAPQPVIDVWHITLTNLASTAADDVTMRLAGNLIDEILPDRYYAATTDLPTLGPNTLPDSFFVLPLAPPAAEPDVSSDWRSDRVITLPRGEAMRRRLPFLNPRETTPIAVLSVPTGSALNLTAFSGTGFFADGTSGPIRFVPEPSALLSGLICIGAAHRKRC
ncbi:MAG: hypothetical protein AAF266_11645 [Planctomycetota bacterium]